MKNIKQNEDPLEELYVDKDAMDRERLAKGVKPFIGIDRQTGEPFFKKNYSRINNMKKIVVYLLYRRAAEALGQFTEEESHISSKNISKETGVKYTTVRGTISKLNFVVSDSNGNYYIPAHGVSEALNKLGVNENEG